MGWRCSWLRHRNQKRWESQSSWVPGAACYECAMRGAVDFLPFVLCHLPPPARMLEVGCGDEGGLVPDLVGRGYEVVGDQLECAGETGDRPWRLGFYKRLEVWAEKGRSSS